VDPADYGDRSNEECSDGVNNDMAVDPEDTFTDCDDFGCTQNPDVDVATCPGERTDATCNDGINNDMAENMFTDCDDFGCSRNPGVTVCDSVTERNFANCTDGMDNDGDGFVDCRDNDCENSGACTERRM